MQSHSRLKRMAITGYGIVADKVMHRTLKLAQFLTAIDRSGVARQERRRNAAVERFNARDLQDSSRKLGLVPSVRNRFGVLELASPPAYCDASGRARPARRRRGERRTMFCPALTVPTGIDPARPPSCPIALGEGAFCAVLYEASMKTNQEPRADQTDLLCTVNSRRMQHLG